MADSNWFNMEGVEALNAKLAAVAGTVRYAKGRAALRKAGMIIVNAAKQNVEPTDDPSTDRSIKDNIAIVWNSRRSRAENVLAFRIGVRGGALIKKGQPIPDGKKAATPHWRFIEFGTMTSLAKPFLRPAMERNVERVSSAFVSGLEKHIDRAIRTGRVE